MLLDSHFKLRMDTQESRRFRNIDIRKGQQGYGFIISNQRPCIVSNITKSGPADEAGLRVDDELLQVNGINVENMTHEEVVRMIIRSAGPFLHLMVNVKGELRDKIENFQLLCRSEDNIMSTPEVSRAQNRRNTPEVTIVNKSAEAKRRNFARTRAVTKADYAARERTRSRMYGGLENRSFQSTSSEDTTVVSDNNDATSMSNSITGTHSQEEVHGGVKLVSIEWEKENVNVTRSLYPVLAPLSNDEIDQMLGYRVVLGYLCTIELPSEAFLPSTSLNAITNCVKRLNKTGKKANSTVLMTFSAKGVTLRNSSGIDIITYPLKTLAFSGTCPTDKRFFGIVTRKTLGPPVSRRSPKLLAKKGSNSKTIVCSCHVFLVDPELADHEIHKPIADMFDFTCTKSTDFGGCKEFPALSSVVLYALNSLFRERNSEPDLVFSDSDTENRKGKKIKKVRSPQMRSKSESNYVSHLQRSYSSDDIDKSDDERLNGSNKISMETLKIKDELDNCIEKTQGHRSSPSLFSRFKLKPKHGRRTSLFSPKVIPRTVSQDTGTSFYSAVIRGNTLNQIASDISDSACSLNVDKEVQENQAGGNKALIVDTGNASNKSEGDTSLEHEREITFRSFIRESPLMRRKTRSKKKVSQAESFSDSDLELNDGLRRFGSSENDINASNWRPSMADGSSIVQSWAKSLETLLSDSVGVKYFQEFLKKEFSEENILFWNACEKLKTLCAEEEVAALANKIYDQHLCQGAPLLVNVDQQAAKKAKEMLDSPCPNIFELQQQQIFKLMKFDSFPRFLKSDVYQQCLLLEEQGKLDLQIEEEESRRGKTVWYVRKSKSNAKDLQDAAERKRSILSFLSKGKSGKQEIQGKQGRSHSVASVTDANRRSSMASLPDLLEYRNTLTKLANEDAPEQKPEMQNPCRLLFPGGSSALLPTDSKQSIRVALTQFCEKHDIRLSAYEICAGNEKEKIDLDQDVQSLADSVLHLERKILFRFDLPNHRSVGVKVCPNKTLREVLEPILKRNGYRMKDFVITLAGSRMPLILDKKVQEMENKHLCAQSIEHIRALRQSTGAFVGKPPLGDFRSSIKRLRSKGDDDLFLKPRTADLKPVRSDESLSKLNGNAGIKKSFSNVKGKEKKLAPKSRSKSVDLTDDAKSELAEMLLRTSTGRIDDQRGSIPKEDLELPDFLKENVNSNQLHPGSTPDKQRSLSSGAVVSLAEQQQLLDIDPNEFRPASEVLADCSFQSICDRPSLYSVRSWSEIPTPDRFKIRASSPRASLLGQELDQELAFLGRLSVGSAPSINEHLHRWQNVKGRERMESPINSTFYISDGEETNGRHFNTKGGNLTQWRTGRNSSNSSIESGDEVDNSKDSKDFDSSKRRVPTDSPRSPLQKQQKLEPTRDEGACFVVPDSPVYSKKPVPERRLKPRPLPLSTKEAEELINDTAKNPVDSSSRSSSTKNLSYTSNISSSVISSSDEILESTSVAEHSPQKALDDSYDMIEIQKPEKNEENGNIPNPQSSIKRTLLQRSDSGVSDISVINSPITATGSVNDETVILEDKDMSTGLLNLIQRKRVNKCRRSTPQLQPEREKLLNGETIRGKKNERITFV